MNKIEVQQTGGFPLETDTLDFMQTAYTLLNSFGHLAGNSTIVTGCVEQGNNVSNGVVFFNGELYEFRGGQKGDEVRIVTETETRQFENGETKTVFKKRYAMFGSPGIPWQYFQRPRDMWNLTLQQNQIMEKVVPVGAIVMWAGAINEIPAGWRLCDGTNDTPNLSGRFVVGFAENDNDYNEIGKTGGEKAVTLTKAQMPKHTHGVTIAEDGEHSHPLKVSTLNSGVSGGQYLQGGNTTHNFETTTDMGGAHSHSATVSEEGNDSAHENRPPYYTLAYIQFKGS